MEIIMTERLRDAEIRFETIERELALPEIVSDTKKYTSLMKEYKNLSPLIEKYREFVRCEKDIAESRELMELSDDTEIRELATEEYKAAKERIVTIEEELKILLGEQK